MKTRCSFVGSSLVDGVKQGVWQRLALSTYITRGVPTSVNKGVSKLFTKNTECTNRVYMEGRKDVIWVLTDRKVINISRSRCVNKGHLE